MSAVLAASWEANPKDMFAPIAAVCGAAIAAFVAWFNARKTPSDRLQALMAIYKDWPDNVHGREHIVGLIEGQLGEMWHRYPHLDASAAMKDGRFDIDRAARRHLYLDIGVFLLSFAAVAVSVAVLWPIDQAQEIIVVSLISGFALVVAVTRAALVRHIL